MRLVLLAVLLSTVVAAPALATAPACASVTDEEAPPYGPYVVPRNAQVFRLWLETNLVEGLQRVACVAASGETVAADHDAGEYGIEPGGLAICVPRVGCIWI